MAKKCIDADRLKQTIADNVYLLQDAFNSRDYGMFWTGGIEKAIDEQPAVDIEPRWIPVKTRQMTSDEISEWEEMAGIKLEDEEAVLFDCPMPYDGQEVLICSKYGHVSMDECVCDEYGIGLDVNGDWDGIVAWMPLPEPYRGGEEE